MSQPLEDKGFKEHFREKAEGLSFAPLNKLAGKFGFFASNDARSKKAALNSDQDILSKRSGYVVVDETSAQYDEATANQKREKEEDAKRGISAIFENSTSKSGGLLDAANDLIALFTPLMRNPFSFNK